MRRRRNLGAASAAHDFRRTLMMAGKGGGGKQQQLQVLFDLLLAGLTERVKSGDATAADFQAARQFLKDSNFEFDRENPPDAVKRLVEELPDLDDDPDWPGNASVN